MLSKPLTLEGESGSDEHCEAPNILQRILSLFKNIRQGSDLSCFKASLGSTLLEKHIEISFFFPEKNLDKKIIKKIMK